MTRRKEGEVVKRERFARLTAVAMGLFLVFLGLFLLISFLTADADLDPSVAAQSCWTGLLGAWTAFGGVHTLGLPAATLMAVLFIAWGIGVAGNGSFLTTWPQVLGGLLMTGSAAMLFCSIVDCYDLKFGGLFILYLSPPALLYFGRWGLLLVSGGGLFLGLLMAFGESAVRLVRHFAGSTADAFWGFGGIMRRVGDLLRMLVAPRMATAGATADMPASAPVSSPAVAALIAPPPEPQTAKSRTKFENKWKPRAPFVSRFGEEADAPPPGGKAVEALVVEDDIREEWREPEPKRAPEPTPAPEPEMRAAPEPEPVAQTLATDTDELFRKRPEDSQDILHPQEPEPPVVAPQPKRAPEPRREEAKPQQAKAPAPQAPAAVPNDYQLPPIDLLDPPEPPVAENREQLLRQSAILEQTLAEFKIEGKVVHIERGPRVTLYEISLAPGIRLNKVTSLADNLAMKLCAQSVRIIAPIPGKDTIGIEIPNTEKELVSLREIVETVNRQKRQQALPVCLGKNVSGTALVADLARMPHLLIAGATGSGKSVCINSIIMSVMMCCRPDEAQLIMIDPKVVELSRFQDIPHLMCPVITDMKRAVAVLDWICQKMDERYEQMSQVSVNNIAKFNALGAEEIQKRLSRSDSASESFPNSMPYLVVVIDELADLMMVAGKEVEHHITRLAAKSRAVGIHLILATQRPSVDVITGLIKANMPCRIAFQVASRVDSRTILDQNGADALLGQGDMLYLPPGVGKLTRAQGVFVSDDELFRVVDYTKDQAEPQYHNDLLGPVIGGGNGSVDVSSFDELFRESAMAIIESGRGSVSLLQRKFGVGYGRASRIIDQLASAGILGPFRDGKAREILLTMEEFNAKFGYGDNGDDGSLAGLRDDERGPHIENDFE